MSEHYVYGLHAVKALLSHQTRATKKLYISQEREDARIEELLNLAGQLSIPVERLALTFMKQRFADVAHQGVVASASQLPEYTEKHLIELVELSNHPCLILILDGITDPHNLGACLRSAEGAGADFVIIPKDKNATITPVVSKVACGAAESMPLVRVTNLARAIDTLKQLGVWVYGAAGEAEVNLHDMDYKAPVALVMGAEGKGMRHLTREKCDGVFSIPMLGAVSSLNVSVAAGVCLYEAVRQRAVD